ncbi:MULTISPECIES: alpha/beta hydrolase [unclassified Mycobacterium]|uniref:alpha/beta hydrolase n=1 Tax=unclassified Mycobacterium TaxID=2642494 RepID=UPI0029C77D66|nr:MULTISPECIES: alpha/beta fold hydrolase [unclassified Mycobacterium]
MSEGPDRLPLPATLTPCQTFAVEMIESGPRGALIGPFVPLLRSPELMTRLQLVGEYLRFGSVLPAHLTELIILLIARHWDQDFEWGHHVPLARTAGLSEQTIDAIRGRAQVIPTAPADVRAVWRLVGELCDRHSVTDATFAAAVEVISDVGVVEVVATAGYYTTLAMTMNVARTPVPDGYERLPAPMNAPLVFLHPLGADGRFWDPVRAELGSRTSVAPDLPGHGSAPPPPVGAGIDFYAAAVAEQISTMGTAAHVVGMSLGGLVAQELAVARPELVASAVLVDTVPVYPAALQHNWRERADTARRSGLSSLVDPMVAMWFSTDLAATTDPRVEQARNTFAATDPEGYARSCEVLADVDLRERLASLTRPTTIVCGHDDAPAFREGASWLAGETGDGTVHWLPGRHACAVEFPTEFADLLVTAIPA